MSKNKILTLYAAIFVASLGLISSAYVNPAVSAVGNIETAPVLVDVPDIQEVIEEVDREANAAQIREAVPKKAPDTTAVSAIPAVEAPIRLDIPAIMNDIPVVRVGVTESGIMDTPSNLTQAGWYQYGTVPGSVGSAVIGAHVDNGYSLNGVFKNLKNLKIGDEIVVTMSSGSVKKFEVIDSESKPYADVDANRLFNQDDGSYLKLITCNGRFMPDKGTYDERLVVTAKLI